jgi:hypothetical protein
MGRQRGGAVFYAIPRYLGTPRLVNGIIEKILRLKRRLPNPAQTIEMCATDAILTTLFYSDVVRKWVWEWVFKNCVEGGVINIPDEHLTVGYLLDKGVSAEERDLRRVKAFLSTGAARILRILDKYPGISDNLSRSQSATPAPEMHGRSPSEMCAILAIALASWGSSAIYGSLGPGGKSLASFRMTINQSDTVLEKVFEAIGKGPRAKPADQEVYLTGEDELPSSDWMTVAIYLHITTITPDDWFMVKKNDEGQSILHAVSLILIDGKWYISDNEIGTLLEIKPSNPKNPVTEDLIRKSYLQQNIQKIAETEKEDYGVPSEAKPLAARYLLMDREDITKIVATTDNTRLLHENMSGFRAKPVGYIETWRDVAGTPENTGLSGEALFNYYRKIPVSPEEARSDAADTGGVKTFDMAMGAEFLSQRGWNPDTTNPDIANMVRRIGKMAVRTARIPSVPTGHRQRVYCSVRRQDAPPSVYAKGASAPLPTVFEEIHPAFAPVLTEAQRAHGISVINAQVASAIEEGDPDAAARFRGIQRRIWEAQGEIDDAGDGSDVNRLKLAYAKLDAILIEAFPGVRGARGGPSAAGAPTGGKRRYSRRVRQWGRKKGVGSSTRRRGSRVPKR